jgi:hypothetical protein
MSTGAHESKQWAETPGQGIAKARAFLDGVLGRFAGFAGTLLNELVSG